MNLVSPMFIEIRGAIQNHVEFFYNFRTEDQSCVKLGISCIWKVLQSLAHSDSNCDLYGTSNTTGVAIEGQR